MQEGLQRYQNLLSGGLDAESGLAVIESAQHSGGLSTEEVRSVAVSTEEFVSTANLVPQTFAELSELFSAAIKAWYNANCDVDLASVEFPLLEELGRQVNNLVNLQARFQASRGL